MNIHIENFSPDDYKIWDEFVKKSWNGTIFHTRKFLSYHPSDRFKDLSLIIRNNSKWLGILPATESEDVLRSHPGASYGGPVLQGPLSIKKTHIIIETLLEFLSNSGVKRVEMTLTPIIYHKLPCDYLNFVLIYNNFKYTKRELSAYIPVTSKPFNLYKPEARTATRKAKKNGITVKESKDFEGFYNILKKNLQMRHNVIPTHTLEELLKLKNIFPEQIRLFSSFYRRKQIAGTLIFTANSKVILAFYISHDEEFQHLRPVNLLFFHVLKWAYRNHYKYLDLGTFTLNMKPNFGLGRFKESLGAQGIFRDYLYLDL